MTAELHPTPGPKIPDRPLVSRPAPITEKKIDRQMKDSFPASDPPSFSGGNHIVGAPVERESGAATAETPEVKEAEQKVKDGTAKQAHKY